MRSQKRRRQSNGLTVTLQQDQRIYWVAYWVNQNRSLLLPRNHPLRPKTWALLDHPHPHQRNMRNHLRRYRVVRLLKSHLLHQLYLKSHPRCHRVVRLFQSHQVVHIIKSPHLYLQNHLHRLTGVRLIIISHRIRQLLHLKNLLRTVIRLIKSHHLRHQLYLQNHLHTRLGVRLIINHLLLSHQQSQLLLVLSGTLLLVLLVLLVLVHREHHLVPNPCPLVSRGYLVLCLYLRHPLCQIPEKGRRPQRHLQLVILKAQDSVILRLSQDPANCRVFPNCLEYQNSTMQRLKVNREKRRPLSLTRVT